MTTGTIGAQPAAGPEPFVVLPDAPLWDMHEAQYVSTTLLTLMRRYSDRPDVVVMSRGYLCFDTRSNQRGWLSPDCLVAFGVPFEGVRRRNGYVIDEWGRPPDFVLEVGSPTTGARDYTAKRDGYAAFGVREYWRFDATGGEYHDRPLAGDLLVDGGYEPIPISAGVDGKMRGYSEALDLYLCWEDGRLRFWDPAAGSYLNDYDESEDARLAAEEGWRAAEARAGAAEAELKRLREQLDG